MTPSMRATAIVRHFRGEPDKEGHDLVLAHLSDAINAARNADMDRVAAIASEVFGETATFGSELIAKLP